MPENSAIHAVANFRPMPGHRPRSRKDKYKRIHRYVSVLGKSAQGQLKQALLLLRQAASQMPNPQLQAISRKDYTQAEFLGATKELLCMWIFLEAVDQGADSMPSWVLEFLRLAVLSTDFVISSPTAQTIMDSHGDLTESTALTQAVCTAIADKLGYGQMAFMLSPAFKPLLDNSRVLRQKILKEALTADAAEL